MFWEGYFCEYEDEGNICEPTEPIYFDRFKTFREAMEWVKEVIEHHDNIARWYVKVYKDETDKNGDILCAFSMEWDDPIFNNNAV